MANVRLGLGQVLIVSLEKQFSYLKNKDNIRIGNKRFACRSLQKRNCQNTFRYLKF